MKEIKFYIKLRELREEKKLNQYELAEALHVTQATIANYELNKRWPNLAVLGQIADFFRVSTDYLLGRED